ncbi:hydrolase [Paraneptunicella aestuarii]|uniref:hydrolase n=1 Tax=Paraneptunicella aestuarii TaxID=2831148 RepID=UPI001E50805C|nr:hydrolase [Paraneptunicella aestuarii]UAA38899.1 hydrolase [Paraneptunicella aestuarii]
MSRNNHSFTPPWWAKNRHIQTIWPRFFQRREALNVIPQRLELPDGDFLDLSWSERPSGCKGLVAMFHGLEGSIRSHYANDMIAKLFKDGWWVVLMHFRGCSGEPNRLPRSYHSGETSDALYFLEYLKQKSLDVPKMVAMGFSLGGNMLLKLLGENPHQSLVSAGVAVSPPMRLDECSQSISKGFSRIYQSYLLKSMRENLMQKMQRVDFANMLKIPADLVPKIGSFREFDEKVTAPLHGFASADDYYQRCSSMQYLRNIQTPTLIVHSKDDPFMNEAVVPKPEQLSSTVELDVTEKGGHVGFMQGTPWNPKIWLHSRVLDYLNNLKK